MRAFFKFFIFALYGSFLVSGFCQNFLSAELSPETNPLLNLFEGAKPLADWSFGKIASKEGDVIFIQMNCSLCSLIEEEENSAFSHVGLFVRHPKLGLGIVQVISQVEWMPLQTFLQQARAQSQVLVLRPNFRNSAKPEFLWQRIEERFLGLPYDTAFLWNNFRDQAELLYCSEMIFKVLNPFLKNPLKTKKMHFVKNRSRWEAYFAPEAPPDNLEGISPGDLQRQLQKRIVWQGTLEQVNRGR